MKEKRINYEIPSLTLDVSNDFLSTTAVVDLPTTSIVGDQYDNVALEIKKAKIKKTMKEKGVGDDNKIYISLDYCDRVKLSKIKSTYTGRIAMSELLDNLYRELRKSNKISKISRDIQTYIQEPKAKMDRIVISSSFNEELMNLRYQLLEKGINAKKTAIFSYIINLI